MFACVCSCAGRGVSDTLPGPDQVRVKGGRDKLKDEARKRLKRTSIGVLTAEAFSTGGKKKAERASAEMMSPEEMAAAAVAAVAAEVATAAVAADKPSRKVKYSIV